MITDIQGTFELHNGVKMPYFGLGVFLTEDGEEVINAVKVAIEVGYRHFDTAAMYLNEEGLGKAIQESDIDRSELFITSKVWNTDQGFENTIAAFNDSLTRLNLDYLDLYLIHWPLMDKTKGTWQALEQLYKDGKVRAIGVSNFLENHIEDLLKNAEVVPMVNQVEFHPLLVQQGLIDYCKGHKIQYESWSPLIKGKVVNIDLLKEIGNKYGKSAVQVALRWDLQKGVITIPKSVRKDRIISNADIFDFELSPDEMSRIDGLDNNERVGLDPHFPFPSNINLSVPPLK